MDNVLIAIRKKNRQMAEEERGIASAATAATSGR